MASKRLQVMGVIPVNEEDYGKSAYELAVDHGFKGSEEEWLASLKGADGKPGSNGKDGAAGYTPVKGTDYFTPSDKEELANTVEEQVVDTLKSGGSIIIDDYDIEQGHDVYYAGAVEWTWCKRASGVAEIWGTVCPYDIAETELDGFIALPLMIWAPKEYVGDMPIPTVTYSVNNTIGICESCFDPKSFEWNYEADEEGNLIRVTHTMWSIPYMAFYNIDTSEGTWENCTDSIGKYTVDVRITGRWKPLDDNHTPQEILAIKGEDGHTPEKGVEYFTEEDVSDMVSQVISKLPVYNGEVV